MKCYGYDTWSDAQRVSMQTLLKEDWNRGRNAAGQVKGEAEWTRERQWLTRLSDFGNLQHGLIWHIRECSVSMSSDLAHTPTRLDRASDFLTLS